MLFSPWINHFSGFVSINPSIVPSGFQDRNWSMKSARETRQQIRSRGMHAVCCNGDQDNVHVNFTSKASTPLFFVQDERKGINSSIPLSERHRHVTMLKIKGLSGEVIPAGPNKIRASIVPATGPGSTDRERTPIRMPSVTVKTTTTILR